jgi:hypothetical protein
MFWLAMTLMFEFSWGGLVEGLSWGPMLADYDPTAGRIWLLVPIWTVMVPAVVRHARPCGDRWVSPPEIAEADLFCLYM